DADLLDATQIRKMLPFLNYDNARFPIQGGLLQRRAGTARHDAVVWGYAHAADKLGVDVIQNCEVTGFIRDQNGAITGVETS
ncbi:FAD-dependent oxidoreductase, partial [Mesorhizobium sp. M2D.F.Ca.ET.140.01.1.1]